MLAEDKQLARQVLVAETELKTLRAELRFRKTVAGQLYVILRDAGRPLKYSELIQAIKKTGRKWQSRETFYVVLCRTLGSRPDLFRRIKKGDASVMWELA